MISVFNAELYIHFFHCAIYEQIMQIGKAGLSAGVRLTNSE